ncbi:substrate-binding domain-containing protein [Yoonia sp. SS1-5]|uniref:Substrate-binding domain-containing protein n=1 Tax=Yoonia rhodophyticola TaxID=3137370 RepID=A0AAN0NI75_9RHOB
MLKTSLMQTTMMAGVLSVAALAQTTAAYAEEVTLRAMDGSSDITANLMDFDGNRYTLETAIGEIQIDASQVECIAGACPTEAAEPGTASAFEVAGNPYVVDGLLPSLFQDFASGVSGSANVNNGSVSIASANGADVGTVSLVGAQPLDGMRRLVDDRSLLAISDRPMTEEQARVFSTVGKPNPTTEDRQVVLALDGLVIVAAPGNPVNAISRIDIARIFAGQITNWRDLGGPNAPINIYTPANDSSIAQNFAEQVMAPASLRLTTQAETLSDDAAVSDAVAADPFGIGFVNFSGQTAGKAMSILGECGIQTPPNAFTIKTEEYPFTRRLLVYRATDDLPQLADDFISYLDTADAQNVIAESGFVDKTVSVVSSDEQGRRYAAAMWPTDAQTNLRELGDMVTQLLPAQRVSLTFRFLPGSSQLEARALEDVQRLADLLAAGEVFANKELLLVGFTDSAGAPAANRGLSEQRAERVRQILSSVALPGSLDSTPIRTLGYGEASPLTCNTTAEGRATNRRVEVWVRDIVATN